MAEGVTLVKEQFLSKMATLMFNSVDVESRDSNCVAVLHEALEYGVECVVDALFEAGVRATARDEKGFDALYYAVRSNSVKMVDKVLSKEINVDSFQDNSSTTALHIAVKGKMDRMADYLLEKGASVNVKDTCSCFGNSAFYYAIDSGQITYVEKMIKKGANLNDEFQCKRKSPVHVAVERGFANIVALLLENGSDPNHCDLFGSTPLHYAVVRDEIDIAKVLLKHKAKIQVTNDRNGESILHRAAMVSVQIVQFLLEDGVEVDIKDSLGETPLFRASGHRLKDVVKVLLDAGADLNHKDTKGRTALHHAGSGGVVDVLVERGADVNVKDHQGDTPLILSLLHRKPSTVEPLMRAGSRVDIKNNSGQSFVLLYHDITDINSNCYKAATEYLIKLKLANLDEELTNEFQLNMNPFSSFQTLCLEELHNLKRFIVQTISLYDILTVNCNDYSILKVPQVMEIKVKSQSLEIEYPNYCHILRKSVSKIEKRNELISSAKFSTTLTLGNQTITVELPENITSLILESLSERVFANL